jgi:mono/diheme cytochrome c family protein
MRSTVRFLSAVLLAAMTLLWMAAAIPAPDKPDGATLFQQKCAMCHAKDGKGYSAIKTPDFTSPKWQADTSDKEIVETIKKGKNGTPMKAFGDSLKEDEIQALLEQIRSFNSEKKK